MYLTKYLYNKFLAAPPSTEDYIREYNAILEKINEFGNEEDAGETNRHVEESDLSGVEFFRHKGIVQKYYYNDRKKCETFFLNF